MRRCLVFAFGLLMLAAPSRAEETPFQQPALFSLGGGYVNFDQHGSLKRSAEMRLDYRWGTSLFSAASSSLSFLDSYLQLHPMVGVSVNSLNALYGSGGFAMDFFAGSHGIVSWSEGVGAFDAGRGPSLGAIFEIRSTAEAGYVFDNQVRTTFYVSHTSNDRVALKNPGSETMGFYVHVPVEMLTH